MGNLTLPELVDSYMRLHPELDHKEAMSHVVAMIAGVAAGNVDVGELQKLYDPRHTHTADPRQAKPL